MAYYETCPNCGASLDPGEKCDCQMNSVGIEKKKGPQVREHHANQVSIYTINSLTEIVEKVKEEMI